jgi:hypothetical protein
VKLQKAGYILLFVGLSMKLWGLLPVNLVYAQQSNGSSEPIFPSDAKDPDQVGGAKLLDAVCPDKVFVSKGVGCQAECPEYTSFPRDGMTWTLDKVTLGHFLSPTSQDAVLSMDGCEPHSANFGGTILLTRRSQGWSMLWYKSGVDTLRCHKVALRDGREILVCIGEYGGQGNVWTELYVEDLLSPTPALMAGKAGFFSAYDNTFTCGQMGDETFPIIRSHIDRVEFISTRRGEVPAVTVTATFGKKSPTPDVVKACMAKEHSALPAAKRYRIDFFFDGSEYRPAQSSIDAAGVFEH